MRRSNVSLFSSAANRSVMQEQATVEASLVPAQSPRSIDPLTLPLMQQAALMTMHESHFARAVRRRMLEDSQDTPQASDYQALADLDLCHRPHGERWSKLTAAGSMAARELQRELCISLDIHAFLGPIGSGPQVSFSCPCGWSASVRNSHTAPGNARASFNRHHTTAAGMRKLVANLRPPMKCEVG